MFSISKILSTRLVKAEKYSKFKYLYQYENNFTIMKDLTLIGVEFRQEPCNILVQENFRHNNVLIKFKAGNSTVTTVRAIPKLDCILAGDYSGNLFQLFCTGNNNKHKLAKTYGYSGIGRVFSTAVFNQIVFIGGFGFISAVNVKNGTLLKLGYKTAVQWIMSLTLCMMKNKIVLAVNGTDHDFSDQKTDLVDVSSLLVHLCLPTSLAQCVPCNITGLPFKDCIDKTNQSHMYHQQITSLNKQNLKLKNILKTDSSILYLKMLKKSRCVTGGVNAKLHFELDLKTSSVVNHTISESSPFSLTDQPKASDGINSSSTKTNTNKKTHTEDIKPITSLASSKQTNKAW